jgi:hypothetical protein
LEDNFKEDYAQEEILVQAQDVPNKDYSEFVVNTIKKNR